MIAFSQIAGLIVTALLWGITNPLMARGSASIARVPQNGNLLMRSLAELKHILMNWKFVGPWLVNQCGSVVFFATLSTTDLSVAVPLANGLTFAVTAATGHWLGERHPLSFGTVAGVACVCLGVAMCLADHIPEETQFA